jgi:hypothetical protein
MVTGSARLRPLSDYTANFRPVLPSERAPHRYKTANFRQQHSDSSVLEYRMHEFEASERITVHLDFVHRPEF